MENESTIKLKTVIDEMNLTVVQATDDMEDRLLRTADVLRPGLQLASEFYTYFDFERLLLIGMMEYAYLDSLSSEDKLKKLESLFMHNSPALIVTTNLQILPEILEAAKKTNMPVLQTAQETSSFMAALIGALNVHLAPRITRHGVLVEVYGEGILLLGESGVGKSETAIELVKRGHRLVADDAVDIKRVSSKTLVGSSPDVIKHFVEILGIVIVDIQKIFGMGSIKDTEKIDLIMNVEPWDDTREYERLGLEDTYMNILDIDIPSITVPVKPGRNLAVIVEIAAMNHRQKKMGYSAVEALNKRLMAEFGEE